MLMLAGSGTGKLFFKDDLSTTPSPGNTEFPQQLFPLSETLSLGNTSSAGGSDDVGQLSTGLESALHLLSSAG